MKRLTGLSAGFLYLEVPAHPMHTLKVIVLEPPRTQGVPLRKRLIDWLAPRLHLVPPFRRRVVDVPFGLHHPVWIEDPAFDLTMHIKSRAIPAPGTRRALDGVVADLAAIPLDRSRPLWEMWALDGLADGSDALLIKVHHAVADGMAAARLLENVTSTEADAPFEEDAGVWTAEDVPRAGDLVRRAVADWGGELDRLPRLARDTALRIGRVVAGRRAAGVHAPLPVLDAPKTSLNGTLSPRRSFASAALSLTDARAVSHSFGATLTDVVLALVGGSLREYLQARRGLPERALIASVPVSSETEADAHRLSGNRISSLFTTLATDIADPAERLRVIHVGALAAKDAQRALGSDLLGRWAAYASPSISRWALRRWVSLALADRVPPPINVIVSSVPGPRAPIFLAQQRVAAICSVGPVLEGIGLNVTVWSYVDRLEVGVLACRAMVPDAHRISEGMVRALADLRAVISPSA